MGKGFDIQMKVRQRMQHMAALVCVLLLAASCVFENGVDPEVDISSQGEATMGLSIKLASVTGVAEYEEEGSVYENYIDLTGGDYRIYFFTNSATDGNDSFIASFTPSSIYESAGGSYTNYSMFGEVPSVLLDYHDFKIVVLANWGEGNYPAVTSGTTIDGICNPSDKGIFNHKTNFELDENNLIPFYGVQEYEGETFLPNHTLELDNPVNLIRSMAKIEVVLENSDIEIESVELHRYNAQGYCAPEKVYNSSYADYGTDYGWRYVSDDIDVHLVGHDNDSGSASATLSLAPAQNSEGKKVWYGYVPEYNNTDNIADYAYIQLNIYGYTEEQNAPFRVYFSNYADGTASAGADYDIGRNILYRFKVTLTENWLSVHVDKWEDSFHNDFTFGEGNDDD